jgi:hypothetical protein
MLTQIPTIAVVAKKSGLQFFLPKKLVFLPKNRTKKKSIKPLKILKKTADPVRFRFYKQKNEKTEQEKNEPNRFCPKKPDRNSSV